MSAPAGHPVLEFRHVSKSYGALQVLPDLEFSIHNGEYVTVVGPSGSGKSTVLRIIAGLERCDSGELYINGVQCTDTPSHRRGLGVVFQNYALFPHLTVLENVAYPLRMRRVARARRQERAARTLARVGLSHRLKYRPSQLSGGEQQRVALARALVYDPTILLLDEPLAALDRQLRDEMRVWLRAIQQEFGVTTLHVTHDQEEALGLGDRVAVMRNGRIEHMGGPRDVVEEPQTPFVAEFLGSSLVPATIGELDGDPRRARAQIPGGWLDVAAADDLSVGQTGSIALPVEALDPVTAGVEPDLIATVDTSAYLGTRYVVQLVLSESTTAAIQLPSRSEQLPDKSQVLLRQNRRVWFIPDEQQ